ncbi:MAG: ACP S-malonyltransferase [Chlorobium sp.]|nr:ACP S-malonyltransferase [Chlorobium sp.]
MARSTVFLYPGQGSQHVGMGFDLYLNHSEMRQIFDRADHFLGFSLSRLCFEGPIEELNQDLNAQLAIYTLSCGLTDILKKQHIRSDAVAGYSSGFYAAAYAAGCFDFSYGLEIVWRAGKILLDEGRKINGSMAVIFGLPFKQVAHICQQVKNAQVAIINTPRQIIISGLHASINKAMALSLNLGALDAYILPVATAYHSGFMEPCRERFLNEIKGPYLKSPLVPLISYFTLDYVNDQKELKKIMATQLSNPVLWVDLIKKLGHNNNRLLIEVGPGAVLFRTVRWIDRTFEITITATEEGLIKAINRHNLKSE